MRRFLLTAVRAVSLLSAVAVLAVAFGAALGAGGGHSVVQRGRAFHPGDISLDRGDALTIHNQDEFIHQIYVKSDSLNFDSDEQQPGQDVVLKFPASGTFEVKCHIHPKMLLVVHVK